MMNRVRGYRTMLCLTQKELADELEITPQSLSAKENCKRSFNDMEKIYLLNRFKKIDPNLTLEKLFFAEKVSKSYQSEV